MLLIKDSLQFYKSFININDVYGSLVKLLLPSIWLLIDMWLFNDPFISCCVIYFKMFNDHHIHIGDLMMVNDI